MKYMVLPITFLLLIVSCASQEVCDDDNQSYLVARFKTWEGNKTVDTIIADASIYGIREGKEDSLIYQARDLNKVQLPLDPNHDITRFVISNDSIVDTLFLSHSSEVYLINYTCGFASRFKLEQYESAMTWMKEIELRKGEIDAELTSDEEHLWIYF